MLSWNEKVHPRWLLGSLAIGAAVEAARTGAGKISDRIDEKMQEEFDKIAKVNTKTLLSLLIRDLAMAASSIVGAWNTPTFDLRHRHECFIFT